MKVNQNFQLGLRCVCGGGGGQTKKPSMGGDMKIFSVTAQQGRSITLFLVTICYGNFMIEVSAATT